jgi:pyruvate/2-oxoglutarate dehydrogenase complex dihydrolipoamide dehydrogenase (E3) component
MAEEVDVVVVGMGPGGEEVANRLAKAGMSVVGVEAELLGGECPYYGCIPSKMMIRAANLLAEARRIPGMAGAAQVSADWRPVATRIRDEATDSWDDTVAVDRFVANGGRFVRGYGRLVGPGAVGVGDEVFHARRGVVIASGGRPWAPPIPGLSDVAYWTNREAIATEELPSSLAVIGGGAIALELGQVYARFGVEVRIVEVADRLLSLEEPEASELIERTFAAENIAFHTGAKIASVAAEGDGVRLDLGPDGIVDAECLLVATGRRPELSSLGLDTVGLDPSARALVTDDHQRVAPGIWALGDITGVGAFTHISMYQAEIVIADISGQTWPAADYRALPRVTFTDPEIGAVGATEAAARAAGLSVAVGTYPIPSSTRGWIHKVGNEGFIKLVCDTSRDVLVGATSAGPSGGEVLGLLSLAVHAEVPVSTLRSMIYAYPTFHRAIEPALAALA